MVMNNGLLCRKLTTRVLLVTGLALGCSGLAAAANDQPVPLTPKPDAPGMIRFESCARPAYPEEAFRQEHKATVLLRFLVGADGRVKQALVARSSGYPVLDEAARAGLAKCSFHPPVAGGKPVDAWTPIQYVWDVPSASPNGASVSEANYEAIGRYIYGAARFGGDMADVTRWIAADLGVDAPAPDDAEGMRGLWRAFFARYPTRDELQQNHARFLDSLKGRAA
jgi:TonB family protein